MVVDANNLNELEVEARKFEAILDTVKGTKAKCDIKACPQKRGWAAHTFNPILWDIESQTDGQPGPRNKF